jgi:beta-fructofuranosidase
MYTNPGFGVSELGDIEVVPDGDDLHLFHLTLPNHDAVQHAVSQDGLTWRPLPVALRTGDPGEIDDDQIWTMSVTPRPAGRGYVMLYTALAMRDRGRVQRVAFATSDDLVSWTKRADLSPIAADERWYEHDPTTIGAVSWRDPKPTLVDGRYVATICARTNEGAIPRRGCCGLMVSDDLAHWEVQPPLFWPKRYWDLECPQLFSIADPSGTSRWYLLASAMEDRSLRYWIGDGPEGPFHVPPGGDILAPAGHYAARVTHWQGRDLLFAWHQNALHAGWQSTPATVDWVEARNPFGKHLAPPCAITARDDGRLALSSFPGWGDQIEGGWQAASAAGDRKDQTEEPGDCWRLEAPAEMAWRAADAFGDDMLIEGMMHLDAGRGGLSLRLDDEGSGLYVELTPGARSISLQRWGVRSRDRGSSIGLIYRELQRHERYEPIATGEGLPFRMITSGPYVEVSLGGEIAIATMTGTPRTGQWGFWVEDGSCRLRDVRWAPLKAMQHGEDGSGD